MTENSFQGQNRRSIFNIRFMKGTKLRLLFGTMTAGMLFSSAMLVNVIYSVNKTVARFHSSDLVIQSLLDEVCGVTTRALLMGLIFTLASAIMALLFGLLVSHRFYGPIVPLSRQLKEFAAGNFKTRVRLRPEDELLELAEAQNALGETLEKQAKSPR
jgi:nitrogen fixation/metabolism regulation signal transduction histidine kinase